ncbi:small acid-soluble spore protein SspI [Alkalicoccobacillus porphyridii]|uniref:Small, acid-soluble spore protein I n=1 Tax=Alkalicoccobacillus porphyridii TaxID=2597270 RepID=A0A554A4I0_9BACI|nr:small acid-soluble spore protein SspI [Alkalicoccobacillus porphyridii]TSB48600.1 small acid-soluble spore protein SspI [Alkalicoccobacillus porphyridii]
MGFNLRSAIMANIQGNSEDQVEATILDAIQNGEEKMLPGLGVMFEVCWKEASSEQKNELCELISQGLQG